MKPETVQKLLAENPEMLEFRNFLAQQARTLAVLSDIELTDPVEIAVEVKARKKAYDVLLEMLSPLINNEAVRSRPDPEEYAV